MEWLCCCSASVVGHKTEQRLGWGRPTRAGMKDAGHLNSNNRGFQLWQQHNNPIQLISNSIAHQKLDYLHYNPVEAGFVSKPEDWLYSSAIDYYEGKGLLEIKI